MIAKKEHAYFASKTVVVYGATGGLGEAICSQLNGRVQRLILTGRSEERLEKLCKTLETEQHTEKTLRHTVTTKIEYWAVEMGVSQDGQDSPESQFAARIRDANVDGVIIATGKTVYRPFCGSSEETPSDRAKLWCEYQELIAVNLSNVFRLAMELLPYLKAKQGFFHISGSYASIIPIPYQAVYSATKAALFFFVEAVERELQSTDKSRRNLLSISLIGGMATNMYYQNGLDKQFKKYEALVLIPPSKIARSIVVGLEKGKRVISVKLTGFCVVHFVRRLPVALLTRIFERLFRRK